MTFKEKFKLLLVRHPYLRPFLGGALICLGVVGLFLPILQGVAFIIMGFIVLGNKELLHRIKHYLKRFKR